MQWIGVVNQQEKHEYQIDIGIEGIDVSTEKRNQRTEENVYSHDVKAHSQVLCKVVSPIEKQLLSYGNGQDQRKEDVIYVFDHELRRLN